MILGETTLKLTTREKLTRPEMDDLKTRVHLLEVQEIPTLTNAMFANMADATVKGRARLAGTGVPVDLTATQVNAIVGSADLAIGGTTFVDRLNVMAGGIWLNNSATAYYVGIRLRPQSGAGFSLIAGVGDSNAMHSTLAFEQITPVGAGAPTASAIYLQTMVGGVLATTMKLLNQSVEINGTGVGAMLNVLNIPGRIANYTVSNTASGTSDVMEKYAWSGWDLRLEQEFVAGSRIIYNWIHNYGGTDFAGLTIDGVFTGLGTKRPQGRLHGYDGTGSVLSVSKAGVAGTLVTVVPDGTGDVTAICQFQYAVVGSNGVTFSGNIGLTPGNSSLIFNTPGVNTMTLAVAANGSVTLQRTLGALTYTVNLLMNWI